MKAVRTRAAPSKVDASGSAASGGVTTLEPKRAPTGSSISRARGKKTFLKALAATCVVTTAAKAAGVDRGTAYDWRDADDAFREAWDDALVAGSDAIEEEAIRRAMAGSDYLMVQILKAHKPEKYRERQEVVVTEVIDRAAQMREAREKRLGLVRIDVIDLPAPGRGAE